MIVRIDHLTLSSPDLARHRLILESLGYRERFFARDVPNLRVKAPLVSRLQDRHDLVLFDAPGSVSIEVINQGVNDRIYSPIVPVFENPAVAFKAVGAVKSLGSLKVLEVRFEGLDLPVYVGAEAATSGFACSTFVTRVPDVAANVRLWEAVGCRRANMASEDEVHLTLSSPVDRRTRHFYFVPDDTSPSPCRLDSFGFNYWALVSTSPSNDRDALEQLGFSVTPLETCTINGRMLSLFFATGPGIVPVEILGPASSS